MTPRPGLHARTFQAMGTTWWVCCDAPALLAAAEARVRDVEARLSRFRPGSALSRLNRERAAEDAVLAQVTGAALRLEVLTGGAFTPSLGARLEALGYDRSFESIGAPPVAASPPASLRVHVEGERVRLEGEGALDLGGVAKGWTVDLTLRRLLDGGAHVALVDGGGDLRGAGRPWPIGLGGGLAVDLAPGVAAATSSTRRRRWRSAAGVALHHVLDPRTGEPARSTVDTVTVIAGDAATADALATAVLVDPAGVLARLPALGARAAVRDRRRRWWTTPGWEAAA